MGWYDANPVHLNPLEPSESAKKWVEYLGDIDEVLRLAKKDFDEGEYQWVAEITNVIVYADPENKAARFLCADALEQLGYQAESGTWRNAYLTAALELRNGNFATSSSVLSDGSLMMEMTTSMMFDYMGILLDKQAMAEYDITMNIMLSDLNEKHMVRIKNGVVLHYENDEAKIPDITITCPKNALFFVLRNNKEGLNQAAKIEGNIELLDLIMSNFNQLSLSISPDFNIIEP
jgi:alkyl sulfatase BDS1-like metallo-beta-lactamase superfamily hydrolase